MVTKEIYENGITCRGICDICNYINTCYQYSTNQIKEKEINMTGTEYCKSCEKLDVCMYTNEFVRVVDETNENMQKSSFKDNITIDYRCKFYKGKPQGNVR